MFSGGFLSGIGNLAKSIGGVLMSGLKGIGKFLWGAVKEFGQLITGVIKTTIKLIVVGVTVALMVAAKILFGMVKSGFAMQKELGIGVGHAISLNVATREAAAGGFMYGEKMEDSWKRAQELVTEWGVVNAETERSIAVASDLERTYGASTQSAAQLAAMMEATSDSTKDVLMADMGKEMKVLQKSLYRLLFLP
jgi:hypothetical protein